MAVTLAILVACLSPIALADRLSLLYMGRETPHVEAGRQVLPANADVTDRPLVGILTQPSSIAGPGASYVAASYVKWVEMAGARPVPVLYDLKDDELDYVFQRINGLVIPGGGGLLRPGNHFYDTAAKLINKAIAANDAGDFFPVHGVCLGIEILSVAISRNYSLLDIFDSENYPGPLIFTEDARGSRLAAGLAPATWLDLATQDIAMQNHEKGVSLEAFRSNERLSSFFRLVSTNKDRAGRQYISTIEAWKYPITATQWHPEKVMFEWTPAKDIPHSRAALRMSQDVADYIVGQARRSSHRAADVVEEDALAVYNWTPCFYGKHKTTMKSRDFVQVYIFMAARWRKLQQDVRLHSEDVRMESASDDSLATCAS